MPGIGDLLSIDSQFGQLFLWNVLGAVVTAALTPEITALLNQTNHEFPNNVISPEMLADFVVRGHQDQSSASDEAKSSGIGPERFDRLVRNSGNPPGPEALAEALRRQFIPESSGNDTQPGYIEGIRQSRLQNQWAEVIKKLDERLPGPENAVDAELRSMRSSEEARRLFSLFGGSIDQYQLLLDVAGAGPTPVEAGVLANRGIIPWDGTGATATTFQQAVAESRFKNKWESAYRQLAAYRPPPRTVTAMLREGSIDEQTATQYLQDYGVPAAALPAYLGKATKSGIQKAHEITEAEIIRLYTERGITQDEARQHLTDMRYSSADADLIIAAADLDYQSKLSTATITAIKGLYLHRHIDKNGAITYLDQVGVKATYRDSLLQLWDLEITAGVKSLTVKQISDYLSVGLLTADEALTKLKESGYSDTDAALIMAFVQGTDAFNTQTNSGAFNPGPTA